MNNYSKELQIRWADLDINGHLRHSVYYDWGAFCRIEFLAEHNLPPQKMMELNIGPVIFREECIFRKEIRFGDKVFITLELLKSKKDYSRWSFKHTIYKDESTETATLILDGAWMDTLKRKLCTPPGEVVAAYASIPLAADFIQTD